VKVKCTSNSPKDMPRDFPLERIWGENTEGRRFPLLVGKEYAVYGVTITLGLVWYYIRDEDFVYYPVWNPSSLFEISDSSLPESWRVGIHNTRGQEDVGFILSFPEWVSDKYFYDKLTNRNDEEVSIFNHYRKLLEDGA
jgi:hypothetical protein